MSSPGSSGRPAIWTLAQSSLAFLAPAGALLYGIARVASDAFYGRLGVSPEEAGLTSTTILTQTAVSLLGLVGYVIGFGVLIALVLWRGLPATIQRLIDPTGVPGHQGNEPPPWMLFRLLATTMLLYFAVLSPLLLGTTSTRLPSGLLSAAPFVIALLVSGWFRWRYRTGPWPSSSGTGRMALVLLVLIPVALIFSASVGDRAASRLKAGRPVHHQNWLIGLPGPGAFSFQADCVHLAWADDKPPAEVLLPSKVRFLGIANGQAVFYQLDDSFRSDREGSLRLASAKVIITQADDAVCEIPRR